MTIRKSVLVLTAGLFVVVMVFHAGTSLAATETLNQKQLQLLFSGAKVEAFGQTPCRGYPTGGTLTLNFSFDPGGELSVSYLCSDNYVSSDSGTDQGKWWVEENSFCMKTEADLLDFYLPGYGNCYSVKYGKFHFGLYFGDTAFWDFTVSHPQFPTKEKLLAALEKLSVQSATAQSGTVTLPPAEYKPLPVGTRIKYDDRIYRVTRTDGFLTTYRSVTGSMLSYLNAYALFGEYAENLYVTSGVVLDDASFIISYKIDTDNKKKLEAFWPLEVGKKTKFEVIESGTFGQSWVIALEVAKAEAISLNGMNYATYVIVEEAKSGSGSSFVGRKWYHPDAGLVIKAERTWTKAVTVPGTYNNLRVPNFNEGEEDNYSLSSVTFPEGTTTHALKGTKTGGAADKALLAEVEKLKQQAEKARRAEAARQARQAGAEKARRAEIARLKQQAEEARRAVADRQAEDSEANKARDDEIALLRRQVEERRGADEAQKARQGEEEKARQAEMARLKQEAVEARRSDAARKAQEGEEDKARQGEIARLKKQIEAQSQAKAQLTERESEALQAREAEVARLRKEAGERHQAEAARKAREAKEDKARVAEMARLKLEAGEARRAEAARKAREAEEDKARTAEMARLKRGAEDAKKARAAEIAQLKRQAEEAEKARLAEVTRLKGEAEEFQKAMARRNALEAKEEKARQAEIARLKREAGEFQKALAERDALEAKEEKARQAEMARLKKETEKAEKARQAEMTRLKKETEKAEKARQAEIASLRQELEKARQAREAEAKKPKRDSRMFSSAAITRWSSASRNTATCRS